MNNAADRKAIRRAEKKERQRLAQEKIVIRTLLNTSGGREWFWEELAKAHIFTALPLDRDQMNRAEGERNAGLRLLSQVMLHCPERFIDMMREANDRSIADSIAADADAEPDATLGERSSGSEPGRESEGPDPELGWEDPSADRAENTRVQ